MCGYIPLGDGIGLGSFSFNLRLLPSDSDPSSEVCDLVLLDILPTIDMFFTRLLTFFDFSLIALRGSGECLRT